MTKKKEDEDLNKKTLESVINSLQKEFGKDIIFGMDEVVGNIEKISTTSLSLDIALGGGMPMGRLIEIYGKLSSGKTTLALTIMANAIKQTGKPTLIVDVEHALDWVYMRNLGLTTGNTKISQPESAEIALEVMLKTIASGQFSVVCLDSVAALLPKGQADKKIGEKTIALVALLMSESCKKIANAASKTNTMVIFINQLRVSKEGSFFVDRPTGGNALGFYISIRIKIKKDTEITSKNNIIGIISTGKVEKNKVAPPLKLFSLNIIFGKGISEVEELVNLASEYEVVEKSGSWYKYKEDQIGQGRTAVVDFFNCNPDILSKVKKDVRSLMESERAL